ncbi:MAG: oligogalacturonate lyase family protein [Bryobacterales bacterium]|nr:oligogalacturonate lyase family protein [Bryobacteraceae bacterium]MDW8130595.1 oligogalacturonate lyase family protein [Bryobacterales bacterium]
MPPIRAERLIRLSGSRDGVEWGKGCWRPPESTGAPGLPAAAPVRRLTAHPARNHLAGRSAFTPEGDALIFASDRDGPTQLFELRLQDGAIRRLTEGHPVQPFSAAVHHGGDKVFFARGGAIWVLRRSRLEENCVVSLGNTRLGPCALAGDWLAAPARQGRQYGFVIGRTDGSRWDFIALPRPVARLEFHPVEPEWLEIAFAGAPRMYRLRRDGAGLECLYPHGPDERVVHETFLGPTGDLVFALWPHALCRMDWESRQVRQIARFSSWHPASNPSGTLVVTDTHGPDEGIFLVDPVTGARQWVCSPEASNQGESWKPEGQQVAPETGWETRDLSWEWTHPHPLFSPDNSLIAFASDRSGTPQLYLATVGELPPPWFGPPPV